MTLRVTLSVQLATCLRSLGRKEEAIREFEASLAHKDEDRNKLVLCFLSYICSLEESRKLSALFLSVSASSDRERSDLQHTRARRETRVLFVTVLCP